MALYSLLTASPRDTSPGPSLLDDPENHGESFPSGSPSCCRGVGAGGCGGGGGGVGCGGGGVGGGGNGGRVRVRYKTNNKRDHLSRIATAQERDTFWRNRAFRFFFRDEPKKWTAVEKTKSLEVALNA